MLAGEIQKVEPVPTRVQINRLEAAIKTLPQLDILTQHHFAKGLYAREISIPAGALLTGKVHKTEHLNIVAAGEIVVWTEGGMRQIKAPAVLVSYPGAKRVGLALADTTWITVHATDKTDPVEIEAEVIDNAPALDAEEFQCLG